MTVPPYTPAESRTRDTFLALMWALSYPGRIYQLPDAETNFALIAETLLDLETSYYTPDSHLESALAQTGAKALSTGRAAYHFYTSLGESELGDIREASIGTMLYPDDGATLLIGCKLGSGMQMALLGPGINGQQALQIDNIPEIFWEIRETVCRFPLGWDVYFVDGENVVGLPRGVRVERR